MTSPTSTLYRLARGTDRLLQPAITIPITAVINNGAVLALLFIRGPYFNVAERRTSLARRQRTAKYKLMFIAASSACDLLAASLSRPVDQLRVRAGLLAQQGSLGQPEKLLSAGYRIGHDVLAVNNDRSC